MSDARTRLLASLGVGLAALALDRPGALAALAVVACGAALAVPGVRARWRWALGLALALVWTTALSQSLFWPGWPAVPLLRVGPMVFWREGAIHGVVQASRLIALTAAGLAVTASTPAERLLSGLVALRVPASLAFLTVTALRLLPVIAQEWWVVREARARRGRPAWRRGPWAWLRLEIALLTPVVARSLRRARTLAETLDARGFDPARPVPEASAPWPWPERVLVGAGALALAALWAAKLLTWAWLAEVWYHPELRALYAFTRGWL